MSVQATAGPGVASGEGRVTQSITIGDGSGRLGNCLQAAVASLLNLPLASVPHFIEHDEWLERLVAFGAAWGYRVRHRSPDCGVPSGIGIGPSPRGVSHSLVWVGGEVVWDPHPSRDGLVQLSYLWAFEPADGPEYGGGL